MDNLALVGTILRDKHQIPSVKMHLGMRLSEYLKSKADHQKWLLNQLKIKKDRLIDHLLQSKKKDVAPRRALEAVNSKLANKKKHTK